MVPELTDVSLRWHNLLLCCHCWLTSVRSQVCLDCKATMERELDTVEVLKAIRKAKEVKDRMSSTDKKVKSGCIVNTVSNDDLHSESLCDVCLHIRPVRRPSCLLLHLLPPPLCSPLPPSLLMTPPFPIKPRRLPSPVKVTKYVSCCNSRRMGLEFLCFDMYFCKNLMLKLKDALKWKWCFLHYLRMKDIYKII